MKKHLLTVVLSGLAILALLPLITPSAPPSAPHVGRSIRQIAHEAGLKSRELAERLGLPAGVDKDASLADLGVSHVQLDAARGKAPNPTESVVKIFNTAAGIYPDYGTKIAGSPSSAP